MESIRRLPNLDYLRYTILPTTLCRIYFPKKWTTSRPSEAPFHLERVNQSQDAQCVFRAPEMLSLFIEKTTTTTTQQCSSIYFVSLGAFLFVFLPVLDWKRCLVLFSRSIVNSGVLTNHCPHLPSRSHSTPCSAVTRDRPGHHNIPPIAPLTLCAA